MCVSVCVSWQVTNVNRDTCLKWFKDGGEISNTNYDLKTGVSMYTVPQVIRATPHSG